MTQDGLREFVEAVKHGFQLYPLGSNQHGEAHWPVIRVLVAHHLGNGLAARPCWGPMHGIEAVSEQGLLEKMMDRLPAGAALVADRNFAVFSVAWTAQQNRYSVLFRITEERARKIAGQVLPPAGRERPIEWRPSREDRRAHPELPADAWVKGRLIVAHIEGENGERLKLYLFTTLEEGRELYGSRWHIELDIRSLKQTLGMHSLSAKTPEMVEKELLLAMAGYNLVRAVQMAAARQANLEPRRLELFGSSGRHDRLARSGDHHRPGGVGNEIPAGAGLGGARQTAEPDPPPVLSERSLGPWRKLFQMQVRAQFGERSKRDNVTAFVPQSKWHWAIPRRLDRRSKVATPESTPESIDDENFRRRILTQLNRGEGRHSLAKEALLRSAGRTARAISRRPGGSIGRARTGRERLDLDTRYMDATLNHLKTS